MIIEFRTREGKIITEKVKGTLTLDEAYKKYSSPLFQVFNVKEDTVGKLSNDRACQIISNEGIGYAVQSYINGTEFSDPETVRLWIAADIALDNLQSHLDYEHWED